LDCPYCSSKETRSRKKTTKLGYKVFYCLKCQRKFNERTGSPFNQTHFPTEIIFLLVHWRLRYKLSYRDLAEMFIERGFEFTHETVRAWEERFAPLLTSKLKEKRKNKIGKSRKINVDETYLKVNGNQVYLYRAIDKFGNLVDVRLSKTRDMEAAKAFFKKILGTIGKPERVITDKHESYPKAIRTILGKKVKHRTSKYLNNLIEADHRGIKGRYQPMKGFKNFESAARFIEAYEEQRDFFRTRTYKNEKVPLLRQRTLHKLRFAEIKKAFLTA